MTSTAAFAKQLDKLARKIAGNTDDAITLDCALQIAQAELDLARVRRAKVALIERASAFGVAAATMPSQEPDRSAEAVRRVLPELRQLDRYERRAAAQRERAVRNLYDRRKSWNNL